MIARWAIAVLACAATAARADGAIETGVFTGGFISNHEHGFFDAALYTPATRPRLGRVDPELGARVAYALGAYLGVEAEASAIIARVVDDPSIAKIYGLRAQVVAQLPGIVTPFADLGIGLAHLSSDPGELGNATDFPIHVGAGLRWYVTDGLALRADAHLLRGPSTTSSFGATYGDFSVGISFVTDR